MGRHRALRTGILLSFGRGVARGLPIRKRYHPGQPDEVGKRNQVRRAQTKPLWALIIYTCIISGQMAL
jgi:hypothetical protein